MATTAEAEHEGLEDTQQQGAEVLQPAREGRRRAGSGTAPFADAAAGARTSPQVLGPDAKTLGTLTEPREFNLMFKTYVGALSRRGRRGVPPPRDGPGHLRQLQERLRQHARADPLRHRPDRQELPQRDHAAELHLPLARVRADGDRVLLPPEHVARSGTSYWRDRRLTVVHRPGPGRRPAAAARPRHGGAEPLLDAARPTSSTPSRSCRRASSASWRASPTAAISTSAATWKASWYAKATAAAWSRLDADGKPKWTGQRQGPDLLATT